MTYKTATHENKALEHEQMTGHAVMSVLGWWSCQVCQAWGSQYRSYTNVNRGDQR